MTLLDTNEIEKHCQQICILSANYYSNLAWYFDTMYLTGCRHIEIYELERWQQIDDSYFSCQTAKKGDVRIVQTKWMNPGFTDLILQGQKFLYTSRYHMMRMYCQRFGIYPFASIGHKQVGVHIFRHLRIKRLYEELRDIHEVSLVIGERDDKNTTIYIRSEIYTPD